MIRCRLFAFALILMLSLFGADVAISAERQVSGFRAAELSRDRVNILPESDLWVVTDSKLSSRDMTELQLMLAQAESEGRFIYLEFPNLVELPAMECEVVGYGAGEVEVAYGGYCVVSVKMPKVVKVGDNAFLGSYRMHTLAIPKATHIGRRAFAGCGGLVKVDAESVEYYLDGAFYSSGERGFDIPTMPMKTRTQIRMESDAVIAAERELAEMRGVAVARNVLSGVVVGADALLITDKRLKEPLQGVEEVVEVACLNVEVIGAGAFAGCEKLRFLSLATDGGAKLKRIDAALFGEGKEAIESKDIELTVGAQNKGYVDGDRLTVGRFSAEFKSIKIRW